MRQLQRAMIESYKRRFSDDPGYLAEKVEEIEPMELLEAIRNLVNIDNEGMEIVAELTGYSVKELRLICGFVLDASVGDLGPDPGRLRLG